MNVISITDFSPYACRNDWSPAVYQALKTCRSGDTLLFPKNTYHFYADRCDEEYLFIANHDHGLKRILFNLKDLDNITVDGKGSDFIFHGRITPFALQNSRNITLKNFSQDYERPFFTEGEIISADHSHVTLKIDPEKYPFRIEDNQMVFLSPGEWESTYLKWFIEFDPPLHRPVWAGGGSDTRTQKVKAELMEKDVVCFKADFKEIHTPGNIINMTHEMRWNPGVFIDRCENITLEKVTIHHAGAMGVIGQNSKNITLKDYKVDVKEGSGRMVSTNNDASHFVNCEGLIRMEDCTLRHQLDDGVNIHGIYSVVSRVFEPGFIELEIGHFQQNGVNVYRAGDRIALVDRQTHLNKGYGTVTGVEMVNQQYFTLQVDWEEGILPQVPDGICNYNRMPQVHISGCEFRDNRARGILVSTNKKAVVEDNDFYTSGSSLCCGGEMDFWFESGLVKDLIIRNNRFHNCGYAKWGMALISVNTRLEKVPRGDFLHKGFTITGNTFDLAEAPLLYSLSTRGLTFSGNRIRKNGAHRPFKDKTTYLEIESGEEIDLSNNRFEGISQEESVKFTGNFPAKLVQENNTFTE